jgi:hypothetical protein
MAQADREPAGPLNPRELIVSGALIWLTDVLIFALWYDTMPLSPTAKSIRGVQSLVSLVTIGLVIARAVNILQ